MKLLVNRLNKRVMIQRQVTRENSMREKEHIWEDYVPLWAGVEPLRGQESLVAQRSEVAVTTRIRIRYRNDIDRTMMVLYNGVFFEILYIIHPDFNRRELQLMCRERQ